jgi:hypothetical protein
LVGNESNLETLSNRSESELCIGLFFLECNGDNASYASFNSEYGDMPLDHMIDGLASHIDIEVPMTSSPEYHLTTPFDSIIGLPQAPGNFLLYP